MIKIELTEPVNNQKVFILKDFFLEEDAEFNRLQKEFSDRNNRAISFSTDTKTYTIQCNIIKSIVRS